jgi:hypothetical protein
MAKIQRSFVIAAPFRSGLVQLRHTVDNLDKRLRASRRAKAVWGIVLVLFALGTALSALIPVAIILGIGAVIAFVYAFSYKTSRDIEQIREAADTVRRWLPDIHPRSSLHARLDLRCPEQCQPKKTRQSAKKTKKYYRYVPLDLKFALADGNLLAFQIITRLKTKANQEVRRINQVRGRLQLNGARYPAQAGRVPARVGNLSARLLTVDDQQHVCFWGDIDSAAELEQGITRLYQTLTPAG